MADIASAYTSTSNSTLTFNEWWLENPNTPSQNMQVNVHKFEKTDEEDQTVYKPIAARNHYVVRGVSRGSRFLLSFEFLTIADYNKFKTLRDSKVSLLLKRGYAGEQWYIVLGDLNIDEPLPGDYTYRIVSCPAVEVDAP